MCHDIQYKVICSAHAVATDAGEVVYGAVDILFYDTFCIVGVCMLYDECGG